MIIDRIIFTPLERDTIARIVWTPLLLALTFLSLLTSGHAQNVNDLILSQRIASTGRVQNVFWRSGFTITNGVLTVNAPTVSIAGVTGLQAALDAKLSTITAASTYAPISHTQAIGTITGLQTALDDKASLTGSYTNPDWLVSIPFSKITAKPSTLTGYGITEFATEAFLLTPAEDSLDVGDEGLGWVDGRLTLQTDAGSLQWYSSGGQNIMAWSDRLQADSLDISAVSVFTDAPATGTSTGEAGQMAFDEFYFYLCVALNHWKRAALVDF